MALTKEEKEEMVEGYIKAGEVNLFRIEVEIAAAQTQTDVNKATAKKVSQETEIQKLKDFKETLK